MAVRTLRHWRLMAIVIGRRVAATAIRQPIMAEMNIAPFIGAGMAVRALAREMVRRCIPTMATCAVRLTSVIEGRVTPAVGVVTGRALAGVMVRRRVAAVTTSAVRLAVVVKRDGRPVARAGMAS